MLKCSDFIRDLLDLPSDQSIDQAPIHVHQSAKIVRKFVDMAICPPGTLYICSLSTTDVTAFVDLCGHLQASSIKAPMMNVLKFRLAHNKLDARFDIWAIFRLAAKEDDVGLARLAVARFEQCGIVIRDFFLKQPNELLHDISPRYASALLRCLIHPNIDECTYNGTTVRAIVFHSCAQAAKAFTLD